MMRRLTPIEMVLIGSFLFMLFGLIFSWSKNSALNDYSADMTKIESEINQITNYKRSWDQKGINRKVDRLKSLVSSNIKEWRVSRKKAFIKIEGVEIKSLNRFLVKLSSLPIQFITLDIDSDGDKYSMECRCKW
jgi:hypothetical protein